MSARTVRCLFVVSIFLVVIRPGIGSHQAASRAASSPLDLSAMHLFPHDLEAAGFPGYRLWGNGTKFPDELATEFSELGNGTVEELLSTFDAVGLRRVQSMAIARPYDPAALDINHSRAVISFVYEFAQDGPAMDDAFVLFEHDASGDLVVGSRVVGERSAIRAVSGADADPSSPLRKLSLTFEYGRLLAVIVVRDTGGVWPLVPQVEAMAEILADRIADALAGDAPGLDRYALYLTRPVGGGRADHYQRIDGQSPVGFGYLPLPATDLVAPTDAISAVHFTQHRVPVGADGSADDLYAQTLVWRFADAEMASAWIAALTDRLVAFSDVVGLEEIAAPPLGEESLAIRFVNPNYRGAGLHEQERYVLFRVGDLVGHAIVHSLFSVPNGPTEELAIALAACFEAGGCGERRPLPDGLFGPTSPSGSTEATAGGFADDRDLGPSSSAEAVSARGRRTIVLDGADLLKPSPDGRYLAIVRDRRLRVVGLATLADVARAETVVLRIDLGALAWSPDGATIAFTEDARLAADGDLWLMDAATGRLSNLTDDGVAGAITEEAPRDSLPAWSPDGASLAFVRQVGDAIAVYLLPAAGGEPTLVYDPAAGRRGRSRFVVALRWVATPGGERLLVVTEGGLGRPETGLWSVALDGSDPRLLIQTDAQRRSPDEARPAFLHLAAVSAAGEALVLTTGPIVGADGPIGFDLSRVDLTTGSIVKVAGQGAPASSSDGPLLATFSPDGARVAYLTTNGRLIVVDAGGFAETIADDLDPLPSAGLLEAGALTWLPNGDLYVPLGPAEAVIVAPPADA